MKIKLKKITNNFFYFWSGNHGFFIMVLFFTSSLAFFLGKVSTINVHSEIKKDENKIVQTESSENVKVVASKKGSVYHLPWCSGAVKMNKENKIFFENKIDAEKAGYRAAKNCEGL